MIAKYDKKFVFSLAGATSLFLALSPVLDPYIFLEIGSGLTIRVNDIFAILLGGLVFLQCKRYDSKYFFLANWCIVMMFLSLLGLFGTSGTSFSIAFKNMFIWLVYAFLIMFIWEKTDRELFFKWSERIALICVIVVFAQFILGNMGIPVWNGRIPRLSLSKYDGWSGYIDSNTAEIRPCGIFQEPSYVGIYLLIVYAHSLKNNQIIKAMLFAVTMLITTSMVAILGCAIVTIYILFFTNKNEIEPVVKRRIIIVLCISAIISLFIGNRSAMLASLSSYISRRLLHFSSDLSGTRMGSTKWRLLGHIDLYFTEYNLWQKIFGFGAQQYARYFGVVNYSNNFVNMLLNFGIIGELFFLRSLYKIYKKIEKENMVYFLVMVIIFATDQQWYNWFFFYLLTACIVSRKESKEFLKINNGAES